MLRARLSSCASDIESWCRSRRPQLNASKIEAIWFGSKPNLAKLSSTDCSIQVGTSTIQPSAVVRDLLFHLDSELCMKQHVAKMAAACFYHLRRLCRRVGEVTTRLVVALVISRLDCCNSLLAGLPLCTIEPLQRVQNAAARLVFELSPSEHITPSLLQLHWLPIRWRVQFKLCCFMHAVVSCHRTLSSVCGEHRATSHTVAFRSATVIFRLLCTTDKDHVRRAGLLLRRPVCVEHTAAPCPRNTRFR